MPAMAGGSRDPRTALNCADLSWRSVQLGGWLGPRPRSLGGNGHRGVETGWEVWLEDFAIEGTAGWRWTCGGEGEVMGGTGDH
jgi:hypothetical protein